MRAVGALHHLRAGGTSVVIIVTASVAPRLAYWGPDLGPIDEAELAHIARVTEGQETPGDITGPAQLSLAAVAAEGWRGAPVLEGHRARAASAHAFVCTDHSVVEHDSGVQAEYRCVDVNAGLTLTIVVEVDAVGLVRQRLTLQNTGADGFEVGALRALFPIHDGAAELLDLTGRWMREAVPQRHPFTYGRYVRDSRRGRPGPDASLLLIAGEAGFGFERGRVRAVHVAWSGNYELSADRQSLAGSALSGAELLAPGEVVLGSGETYETPWVYGAHGDGLDEVAARFHTLLRSRDEHPHSPRPVVMNVWEAVYFDHDLAKLVELAHVGADIGAELYVLDDGWFSGRRNDSTSLGDWDVDPLVWPNGLSALIDPVHNLGMKFGIWVEPEMVSVASALAEAHPDWILQPAGRMPPVARSQQVLNLANPEAYDHILEKLDRLLSDHAVDFLKWDHNRDLIDAADFASGRATVRAHTLAVYRMLDELRRRHPNVEFENCASGGSRIDLEILARTHRTWVSDCADPIERARVQQYTGLLVPLEMCGNDIAAPISHTTHRTSFLDLRAGIALLGNLGIQWDLLSITPDERKSLSEWVVLYKRLRPLLHSGRVVNVDGGDRSVQLRGVVATDRSSAAFIYAQLDSPIAPSPGRLRFPGLDAEASYLLRVVPLHDLRSRAIEPSPWVGHDVRLSGRTLDAIGVEAPSIDPEQVLVIEIVRV